MSRTLTVTRTWEIRSGERNGKRWTLHGVEANDAQGQPIPYEMKCFSKLPLGPVEVEIERQEHEQYGTSFLLKPVGNGNRGGGAGEIGELRERIARLESEVTRLSSLVDRRDPADGPAPAAPRATAGLPDDDIPF